MANDTIVGDDIDPSRQQLLRPGTNPPPPLFPLPEDYDIDILMPMTLSEFKDRLIFGTSQLEPGLPEPAQHRLHRSNSAPSMAAVNDLILPHRINNESAKEPIVRQVVILFILYFSFGALIYWLNQTPDMADSLVTKLCSMLFVLVGFGFVDLLLSVMVGYVLDTEMSKRLNIIWDVDIRAIILTRLKVGLALGVLVLCLVFGVLITHFVEKIGWFDSVYFSVVSVTTVGYGDRGFKTLTGKLLASIWLLVSAVAIARVFLYLSQARVDQRNREWAKKVLHEEMSISQFVAADIDHNGYVSKSEFVIYKLKMMEKITDMDIILIVNQFDKLDGTNSGRITLSDLLETNTNDLSPTTFV